SHRALAPALRLWSPHPIRCIRQHNDAMHVVGITTMRRFSTSANRAGISFHSPASTCPASLRRMHPSTTNTQAWSDRVVQMPHACLHASVNDKDTGLVLRADGDEIGAGVRVIVSPEAK